MTTKNMGLEATFTFMGKVEDIQDPLKLGRVRVRVFGQHDGMEVEDLLWASVLVPTTSASLAQVGTSPTGMMVGTHVFGFYLDGNERQKLLVIGSMPKIPELDDNRHDVPKLARGENSIKKNQLGPEPKSAYAAEYPYNKVQQSESGHVIEIDDTPGHERLHTYHKSGTYTEINEKGRKVDKTVDDYFEIVQGKKRVYVKGNVEFESGKLSITINGPAEIKSDGLITATCKDLIVNNKKYSTLLSMS